jgi:hypothetical protein
MPGAVLVMPFTTVLAALVSELVLNDALVESLLIKGDAMRAVLRMLENDLLSRLEALPARPLVNPPVRPPARQLLRVLRPRLPTKLVLKLPMKLLLLGIRSSSSLRIELAMSSWRF